MISKKSDSGRLPRLNRTLKRNPQVRDLTGDDLKYLWVAYKQGSLPLQEGLTPQEFDDAAIDALLSIYNFGWTFLKDNKPIGFTFASSVGPFLFLGDAIWLPNASPRNKIEHATNLLNILRKETKAMFTCEQKDNDYYLHIARHGIIRRVGHITGMDKPMILWESKCHNS